MSHYSSTGCLGDLKVADFEAMLKRVAQKVTSPPTCNMNRWADNHYALDLLNGDFDYIVDYLEQNPSVKYQCANFGIPGLHYVFDPTGWAVQLNMVFKRQPSGCPARPLSSNNPMCGGGSC